MGAQDHPLSALRQPGGRCFGQCSDNLRTGPWHGCCKGTRMKHEKTIEYPLAFGCFFLGGPFLPICCAHTQTTPLLRNRINSSIHFGSNVTLKLNHKTLVIVHFEHYPIHDEPISVLQYPIGLSMKPFSICNWYIAQRQRIESWQTSAIRPRSVSAHDTRRCGSVLSGPIDGLLQLVLREWENGMMVHIVVIDHSHIP